MTLGAIPPGQPLSIPKPGAAPAPQPVNFTAQPLAPSYADAISVSLVNGMIVVTMFGPSQAHPAAGLVETPVATVALTPAAATALANGLQQVVMAPLTASASETDPPN